MCTIDVTNSITIQQKQSVGTIVIESEKMGSKRSERNIEVNSKIIDGNRSISTNGIGSTQNLTIDSFLPQKRCRFGCRTRGSLRTTDFFLLSKLSNLQENDLMDG